MKMFKVTVLLCLAGTALGALDVKINQLLDGQLALADKALSQANIHTIPLGDQTIQGGTAKGISLSDIATYQRIGDATLKATDDSTLQSAFSVGLKSMTVHVDSYTSPKLSFQNASFVVGSNQVSAAYSVSFTAAGGCSISFQQLEISSIDKVTMYSADPKMNDIDVTAQAGQVQQLINQYLKSPQFAALLEKNDPCKASASTFSTFFGLF